MLNCKQASLLASKKLDQKLSLNESLALSMHLLMCRLCRRYVHSLKTIRQMLREQDKNIQTAGSPKLSQAARKRIQKNLQKSLADTDFSAREDTPPK